MPRAAPVPATLDPLLAALARGVIADRARSFAARAQLLAACRRRLAASIDDWAAAAATGKGAADDPAVLAEELGHGPLPVARHLLLLEGTLRGLARGRLPRLRALSTAAGPRVRAVPRGLRDRLLLPGYRADVDCEPGQLLQAPPPGGQGVHVVLGAGNVSSMPVGDALDALCRRGAAVLLKLSPLHAALQPVLERVLAPLIERDLLRLCCGDADLGAPALRDPRVAAWHLTGAPATLQAILRDPAAAAKPWTAELGNVTPVVVVPGIWSDRDLRTAANQLAAWFGHNAAGNCATPRLVLTAAGWPQRAAFLQHLGRAVDSLPPRRPFDPRARGRFARFAGDAAIASVTDGERLPFVLRTGVDLDREPHLAAEESFAPVLCEVAVPGQDAAAFADRCLGLLRERVSGALCAHVLAPEPVLARAAHAVARLVDALPHGTVAINTWAVVGYALLAPPWGTGATAQGAALGRGFAHDTLCLRAPRRTVVQAPFRPRPAPPWFADPDPAPLLRALTLVHTTPGPGPALRAATAALRRGRLR
ncbi:MAG: aldehyde dehydrogenase family protein [Planctomycetota bacterium]